MNDPNQRETFDTHVTAIDPDRIKCSHERTVLFGHTTTIICTTSNSRSFSSLPVDSASLAVGTPVPDDDDDLDFFFFNPDGTIARDELEDELLEGFLLPAHIPQRVHFLGLSLLTTINIGLSSLPSQDRARLRDEVHYILNTLHHFQALPGVGGLHAPTVLGPRAPSIHPGSHYVRLFCQGQALRGHAPTLWAEILLTYTFFDRLKVLTRALVATLDLALDSSPYDLECSRTFATLFLPQFNTPHAILERVLSPPASHTLSGIPFGPLTVADHEALALLMPTHITTPLYTPPARPCCRHVSGRRRRLPRHLPASPSIQKPPGFSYFFTRGRRCHIAPPPPIFYASSRMHSASLRPRPPKPKEPP